MARTAALADGRVRTCSMVSMSIVSPLLEHIVGNTKENPVF